MRSRCSVGARSRTAVEKCPLSQYLLPALMLALVGVSTNHADAQERTGDRSAVRGFVTDAESGEALLGATVVLLQSDQVVTGSATTRDGYFLLDGLQPGTYVMRVTFIGFDAGIDTLTLAEGQILNLRLSLEPDLALLDEVVVQEDRFQNAGQIEAGLQRIRPAEIRRIPLPDVSGDLASYVQTLPGVVSTGDRGGQLYIRGGTPTQNLILLDDIPVYQPFHMIGFFSAFPADVVHGAEVYSGGYDASFGGRLSSVIDVSARNGNKNQFQATAAVAPFLSSISVEGPLAKNKTSVLVSVRESVFERVAPGIVSNLPFVFGDQFVKVHSILSETGEISFTALHTYDRGVVDESERIQTIIDSGRPTSPDDEIRWSNTALGMRYLYLLPGKADVGELSLSYSTVSNAFGPLDEESRSSTVGNFNARASLTHPVKFGQVRFGANLHHLRIKYSLDGNFQDLDDSDEPRMDAGFYSDLDIPLGERGHLLTGLHSHLYGGTDLTLEPRVRVSWRLSDHKSGQQISAAWGLYSQNLVGLQDDRDAGDVFTAWVSSPLQSSVPSSMHAIVGWKAQPLSTLRLELEGYYRTMSHLAIPVWTPIARFTTTLQDATASAAGADARVEWTTRRIYLAVNYGLSRVTYRASQETFGLWYGEEVSEYNPPHDRRHQVNTMANLTIGKSQFGLRWQFGSGLPFTRPVGFDDWIFFDSLVDVTEDGEYRVLFEKPYQGRLPAYHRLDLSFEHSRSVGHNALTLKAGIINAYNRENLFYYDVWTLRRVNQMSILPWAGLRMDIN